MGKIKKILENELVGGTQSTDVYPVTSVKAVYDENNERLDNILRRRGAVNISTNYNTDHTAEVLTLAQAIAKVPSADRVLGFSGTFLSADGWVTYRFDGESVTEWTDTTKWSLMADSNTLKQEVGADPKVGMSQKAITDVLPEYNVSTLHPTEGRQADGSLGGYIYDLNDAIALVPEAIRRRGIIIKYVSDTGWTSAQFVATYSTSNWSNLQYWVERRDLVSSPAFRRIISSDYRGELINSCIKELYLEGADPTKTYTLAVFRVNPTTQYPEYTGMVQVSVYEVTDDGNIDLTNYIDVQAQYKDGIIYDFSKRNGAGALNSATLHLVADVTGYDNIVYDNNADAILDSRCFIAEFNPYVTLRRHSLDIEQFSKENLIPATPTAYIIKLSSEDTVQRNSSISATSEIIVGDYTLTDYIEVPEGQRYLSLGTYVPEDKTGYEDTASVIVGLYDSSRSPLGYRLENRGGNYAYPTSSVVYMLPKECKYVVFYHGNANGSLFPLAYSFNKELGFDVKDPQSGLTMMNMGQQILPQQWTELYVSPRPADFAIKDTETGEFVDKDPNRDFTELIPVIGGSKIRLEKTTPWNRQTMTVYQYNAVKEFIGTVNASGADLSADLSADCCYICIYLRFYNEYFDYKLYTNATISGNKYTTNELNVKFPYPIVDVPNDITMSVISSPQVGKGIDGSGVIEDATGIISSMIPIAVQQTNIWVLTHFRNDRSPNVAFFNSNLEFIGASLGQVWNGKNIEIPINSAYFQIVIGKVTDEGEYLYPDRYILNDGKMELYSNGYKYEVSSSSMEFTDYTPVTVDPTIIAELPSVPAMPNKSFGTTSAITDNTLYNLSDYYPVEGGRTIELTGAKQLDGVYRFSQLIGLYDADKQPLGTRLGEPAVYSGSENKVFTYVLPSDCAFIVTYHSRNAETGDGYTEVYQPKVSYVITDPNIIVDDNTPVGQANHAFNVTSAINTNTSFNISDFIPVKSGETIIITGSNPTWEEGIYNFSTLLGLYDSQKKPLGYRCEPYAPKIYSSPSNAEFEYTIPDECAYIMAYISANAGDSEQRYTLLVRYKNPQDDGSDGSNIFKTYKNIVDRKSRQLIPILDMKAVLDEHSEQIKELQESGGGSGGGGSYLPRPSNGVVNFQVDVDTYIADYESNTLNNQDLPVADRDAYIKKDWGILLLPTNYNPNGTPVRLVIACHGTGTWITGSSTTTSGSPEYLMSQGYAVLDMNGVPGSTPTTDRHFGTPIALRCYLAGYNYVMSNYNLKRDGVFVYGTSMGGLSSMLLCTCGALNVRAQGGFCPCIDTYRQAFATPWAGATQRSTMCTKFGFNKGTKPSAFTTTRPVPADEQQYFLDNIDKVIGYNCMWKNTVGMNFEACVTTPVPNDVTTETEEEKALFENVTKIHPCPLKIWHNADDTTVPYKYSKYFIEMCRRGGSLAELRTFPSGGHNAWANGETISGIPTITGGTTSTSTSMYELVNWFKRFD